MKNRVHIFAAVSESLCYLCVYWIIAATMILAHKGWSMALLWPLAWSLLCAMADVLILKKERGFAFLMLLGVGMSAVGLLFFIVISGAKVTGLHLLTLAVGAGMASGLPLYYLVNKPQLSKHLNALDILLIAFVWLLLVQAGYDFAAGTDLLIAAVLLVDAAAAVGLRMNADGGVAGAWKAVVAALLSALAVAALVALLTALFSRSAALTGGFLGALGALFRWFGSLLRGFFAWFSGLFYRKPKYYEMGEVDFELPSVAGLDETVQLGQQSMAWLGVTAGVLVLAVLIALLIVMRRDKWKLAADGQSETVSAQTSRMTGGLRQRWREWLDALRFQWTARLRRDTPPGLLVALQRKARRKKMPRRDGETVRAFIARMAPDGTLTALADDLERHFYGKQPYRLTAAQCRDLRRTVEKG